MHDRFGFRELLAIVNPCNFCGGGIHGHHRGEIFDDVGKVVLLLVVVGLEVGQHFHEGRPVKAVNTGVDAGISPLLVGAVAVLDNFLHNQSIVAKDAAIASRIAHLRGENGRRVAVVGVGFDHFFNGFRLKQGHVTVEDQQVPGKPFQSRNHLL